MGIFHFLNVNNGDCSIIQHPTGHVTVIDVCNARKALYEDATINKLLEAVAKGGNFNQKANPVNPILYMQQHGMTEIFRFILTHPDMDHMDGVKDLLEEFGAINFWDTKNACVKTDWDGGPYRKEDWDFYSAIRDGRSTFSTNRMVIHAGARNKYFNLGDDGNSGGDGLHILAPTPDLSSTAIECDDYNDASYVILYRSNAGRIIVAGDSHDATWEHIIKNHRADVEDVELLIAPHHGRKSERSYDFLNIVRPKLTLFGNAPSEHLAYNAWNSRNLPIITNNQAGSVVVDTNGQEMQVYVTNEKFAQQQNANTFYSENHKSYYLGSIRVRAPLLQS